MQPDPTTTTILEYAKVGPAWFVFRLSDASADAKAERIGYTYDNARQAKRAAELLAQPGERIRKSGQR